MKECGFLTCFLVCPRITCPGMAPPTMGDSCVSHQSRGCSGSSLKGRSDGNIFLTEQGTTLSETCNLSLAWDGLGRLSVGQRPSALALVLFSALKPVNRKGNVRSVGSTLDCTLPPHPRIICGSDGTQWTVTGDTVISFSPCRTFHMVEFQSNKGGG